MLQLIVASDNFSKLPKLSGSLILNTGKICKEFACIKVQKHETFAYGFLHTNQIVLIIQRIFTFFLIQSNSNNTEKTQGFLLCKKLQGVCERSQLEIELSSVCQCRLTFLLAS